MSVLILEKGSGQSKEIMMLEAMGLAPRFIELFKKGLGAGILSSNEIASALPLQTETNKSAWKKEFDWVLNCIQLFGIRIVFGNNKSRRSKSSKKKSEDNVEITKIDEFSDERQETPDLVVVFNEFEFDESKEGERKDIVSERKLPDLYFDEIKSYKSLTPEEERELGKKLLENDEDAREKFIEANLRLVISIAKRFCGRGLEFLDLVQAGNLGLMRAVDKFEWWRGYKFSTFATWWIRAAVTREIYNYAGTIRIPVHIREFWNKVLSVSAEIIQKKGREPRPEEIAREIGLETNKVSRILKAMHMSTVYLEDLFGSDDGEDENRSWEEVFDDKRAIIPEVYVRAKEEIAIILEELKKINVAISYLPPRDAEVVRLRYGIGINVSPQTLEQIGDLMGLTRERIRQIEEKSIKRLQAMGVIKVGEFVDELLERLNWAREIVPDIELDNLFRIDDAEAVNSILPIGEIQLAERVRRRRKNKKCIPKIILPKADEAENRVVKVIKDTAAAYGIPAGEILGKKRNAEIALARQVVMYILREDCRLSFSQIAKALNLKNHTTVMHGYERIKNELSRSRIEGGVRKN